jgi:O-antigen/teichoic acid export membrane protein
MTAYASQRSLRERVMTAGAWTFLGYVLLQVIRLGSNLVVTRLLAPEMMAVSALFSALMLTLFMLADVGIHQTIIAGKRGDDPDLLNTAWTMQIIRGAVIWGACALLGVAIYFMREAGVFAPESTFAAEELPRVMIIGAVWVFIQSLQSTNVYVAERHLSQKRMVLIEVASLVVTSITMIALAQVWKSVWPLVLGMIVGMVVHVVLTHTFLPGVRNRLRWEKKSVREILEFGKWILLSTSLFVVAAQADKVMLGLVATAAQLSFYTIAQTLALAVEAVAHKVTYTVAMPALSQVSRDDASRLPQAVAKVRKPVDAFFLTCAGLLVALGPLIVQRLYDVRYYEAGPMLSILALSLVFLRMTIFIAVYTAMEKTQYLPMVNLAKLLGLLVLMPIGYGLFGVTGVYWAVALHMVPATFVYLYYNHRHGMLDWRYELSILLVLPAAYAVGWLISQFARSVGWLV